MYQTLLVPLDIYEESLINVVKPSVEHLSEGNVQSIHFIHVVPDFQHFCGYGFAISFFPEHNQEKFERKAMEKLKEITSTFDLPGKKVVNAILSGRIPSEILNYSKNINSKLIIMGSRRPSVTTILLGSNASAVMHHTTSPVLIVR